MTAEEQNSLAAIIAGNISHCLKEVLTLSETAMYMGVSRSYLYKLTCGKQIPCYKPLGKQIYFNRKEIETWLQTNRIATHEELQERALKYCESN